MIVLDVHEPRARSSVLGAPADWPWVLLSS